MYLLGQEYLEIQQLIYNEKLTDLIFMHVGTNITNVMYCWFHEL